MITSAASLCVNASTSWNSPSLSSAAASSSPCGGARERDVGACGVLCDISIFLADQRIGCYVAVRTRDQDSKEEVVGEGSKSKLWWGLKGMRSSSCRRECGCSNEEESTAVSN